MVHFSLLYNRVGSAIVLYNFILQTPITSFSNTKLVLRVAMQCIYCDVGTLMSKKSKIKGSGFLEPWRWGRQAVPKRRYAFTTTRCLTTHKSAHLTYIPAEASNCSHTVLPTTNVYCYLTRQASTIPVLLNHNDALQATQASECASSNLAAVLQHGALCIAVPVRGDEPSYIPQHAQPFTRKWLIY